MVAGPVGESAHFEQQLFWGCFYREFFLYMWAKFRMLLRIETDKLFFYYIHIVMKECNVSLYRPITELMGAV